MGNLCIGREDGGLDDVAQYQRYGQLRAQVVGLLEDRGRLQSECSSSFHAACDNPGTGQLSKPLLFELTSQLLRRLSCDSPQTMQVVYRLFEEVSPHAVSVDERTFMEYMRTVLCYVERDLATKIGRLRSKISGAGGEVVGQDGGYAVADGSQRPPSQYGGVPDGMATGGTRVSGYTMAAGSSVQHQAQPDVRWQGGGVPAQMGVYSAPPPVANHAAPQDPRLSYGGAGVYATPAGGSRDASPAPCRGQLPASINTLPPGQVPGQMQARPGGMSPLRAESPMRDGTAAGNPMMAPQAVYAGAPPPPAGQTPVLPPPSPSAGDASQGFGRYDRAPSPMRSMTPQPPPRAIPGSPRPQQSGPREPPPPEVVEEMKTRILNGELRVQVYNQRQELEVKRLAVNEGKGLIAIFGDDGKPSAWFRIGDMQGISKGTAGTHLDKPPPVDHAAAFTFPDGSLCVVFDSREDCDTALAAFKHLCRVPIEC